MLDLMRMCEKVSCLTLQQIANINGLLFFLFTIIPKEHVFISLFDNCYCSTWKREKIDKRIYASIAFKGLNWLWFWLNF